MMLDFKKLFDNLPQGVTIQDSATGKVVYANPLAVKMIGFSSEREFLKTPIEEVVKQFVVMDEKGKLISFDRLPGRKTLKSKKTQTKTVRFHHLQSKKERWSHIISQPFEDKQNNFFGVINTFYDVTESKRKEIANQFLNEMSKELSSALTYETRLKRFSELILNYLADGCCIDLIDNKGDLISVKTDDQMTCQSWRKELLEVVRTEKSRYIPHFSPSISLLMMPLLARGKNLGVVTFIYNTGSQPYNFIDKKTLEEFVRRSTFFLDNARLFDIARRLISQQKETQHILQEQENVLQLSERRFRSIFETSLDAIIITDNEKRIMDVNTATVDLFLLPKRDLIKKKIFSFFPAKSKKIFAARWKKFQKNGSQRGEIEVMQSNDKTIIAEYSAKYDPRVNHNFFVFRDISGRIEEEKRREHLLSIASHELRTPLASIRIFVDILKRSLAQLQNSKMDSYLAKIHEKTEVLSRLIDDLLDLTRIRENKLELFYEMKNFDEFLSEVLKDIQLTLPSHKIIKEGTLNKNVVFDKNRMAQVIINLVKNAVKYSPNADKVIVKVGEKNGYIQLSVQDFGIGIPTSEHKKVFNIFYRVRSTSKKTVEGLGVGLFISSEIIKKHGGRIWIKSQKGKGSTFFILFPFQPSQGESL